MIMFNRPALTGKEQEYINKTLLSGKLSGDGNFTRMCNEWIQDRFDVARALLTTSCTHALEMAAILANIQPGDEVIMPSFTFVSTANAFVLRGARIVFVDIRPDTMNIDETQIEQAITKKTKAIVVVHYAGVACEMDTIIEIARRYNLVVIEDAAQGVMSTYKGRALGSIGDIGCYSFHETKNYQCGEGGALLINDPALTERAEIIREKGTNRSRFFRGQVDKYTWVDIGSSYLPSEINAALLYAQFEMADEILENRFNSWLTYFSLLTPLRDNGLLELPLVPEDCVHNGHMFYIKLDDINQRDRMIEFLTRRDIMSVFHYVPLHSSEAGSKFGCFSGTDNFTTRESNRLLRLPMYYNLSGTDIRYVADSVTEFFEQTLIQHSPKTVPWS